ncbi:hypothetical protein ACFL34_05390 [Candidatus Sumerlaeota bacterium]
MSGRLWLWFKRTVLGIEEFLCDTCRYDYDTACHRPERPNAISCPDYKKGSRQ